MEAANVIRSVIEDIILTLVNGSIEIDVQGRPCWNPYDFHTNAESPLLGLLCIA
ncbi:hypothetical protein [Phyllobacterium salinisoli]|uniref:hypothetical protein n=1 Tax=Phyllobacterium salinisoli TaxID=1899321 RepID=UPI00135858BE|nr:hypothetical protein [Phyllobacterium salinisoli]